MSRRVVVAVLASALAIGIGVPLAPASAAASGSITGVAFDDRNENGAWDAGESGRANELIYLFDASGNNVAARRTDSTGRYTFSGLGAGSWRVAYAADSWWAVRDTLVPTTTGSLLPDVTTTVGGGVSSVDFGWRAIRTSTTAGSPITSVVGPEGLRVESYVDVVTAQQVYDALKRGTVMAEASSTTVRFGMTSTSTTTTSIVQSAGRYTAVSAVCYVAYDSWLDSGDRTLSHEYGHAWSLYYSHVVQQDSQMLSYLHARGLEGDPRVGSSYAWETEEMIAEDYRQLLGAPSASAAPGQANGDTPLATAVPGLRDFLLNVFTAAPDAGTAASPTPTPSPTSTTASPSPTGTTSPSPSPSPTVTTSPSPTPSSSPTPTPTRVKGGGGGCGKRC